MPILSKYLSLVLRRSLLLYIIWRTTTASANRTLDCSASKKFLLESMDLFEEGAVEVRLSIGRRRLPLLSYAFMKPDRL